MGQPRTKPRAASAQISFDFAGPTVAAAPPIARIDPLAERIIALGLAPNDCVLAINRALSAPDAHALPAPWNLPSRLFHWPLDYDPGTPDEPGQLRLRHPGLVDHPAVIAIRTQIPEPVYWGPTAEDECHGSWVHAVDLMTPALWPQLLATRRFTGDAQIATALAFGLGCVARSRGQRGTWTTALAREVLAHLDTPEPADRSRALLAGDGLRPVRIENRIVPNVFVRGADAAWLTIHGLEDGYLAHCRAGWLGVTEKGQALRAAAATS